MRAKMICGAIALLVAAPAIATGYWIKQPGPIATKAEVVYVDTVAAWCRAVPRSFQLSRVRACAEIEPSGVCTIYVDKSWKGRAEGIIQHEKCHCVRFNHDSTEWSAAKCPVDSSELPHTETSFP